MNAYVLDIESQKLYPNYGIVWTVVIKQLGVDRWLRLNPHLSTQEEVKRRILEFIFVEENPTIIGHNFLGFDGWVFWKQYGLSFQLGPDLFDDKPVQFFDTLYASQFLLPDREGKHSLKSWGIRYGDEKIDYRNIAIELGIIQKSDPKGAEFKEHTPQMDDYCAQDCVIPERGYVEMSKEISDQNTWTQFRNGQKEYWLMQAQAFTGFKFDRKLAKELKSRIESMIQELRDKVEPNLPPRKLKKAEQSNYVFPANKMGNILLTCLSL